MVTPMQFTFMTRTPRRFDVIMPPDMAQDMQDLEQKTGLYRGAVFQRALALYKLAIKTRSNVTGLGI